LKETRIEDITSKFGKVSLNFTGIACELYNKLKENHEFERLRKIDHLGLIATIFKTLSHTRYDYFMVQSVLSEIVENTFRGTSSAQGSITINNRQYRGNEILKTWMMLSNFGHCRYTIGDEKAMMIYASKRRGFKSELTSRIKDPDLVEWTNATINKFDYVKFHHILSIYRLYRLFPRNINKQDEIVEIYKTLLLPISKISSTPDKIKLNQLKNIYKNIRNLSIISLDTANSHLPINIDILSTVLSFDFNSDKFQGRKLSQLFDPLTTLLYDNIYLSTEVQTAQRSYEVRAIENMKDLSYKKIIEKSLDTGLVNANECDLVHFVRKKYTLSSDQKLKDHFNITQQLKGDSQKFESSIDFNRLTRDTVIDIYYRKNVFNIKNLPLLVLRSIMITDIIDRKQLMQKVTIHNPIINRLIEGLRKENITDDQIQRIIKPMATYLANDLGKDNYFLNLNFFQQLMWSVLRFFIHSKYYFDLDTSIEGNSIGAIYPDGFNSAKSKILKEIERHEILNPDRAKELSHLDYAISRTFKGFVIVCIDRIKIYDYSLAPEKRVITDIDSLVLKFNASELILEFNETKNIISPVTPALRDLREKFVKVLGSNAKGYRVLSVNNYGAKVRIRICT